MPDLSVLSHLSYEYAGLRPRQTFAGEEPVAQREMLTRRFGMACAMALALAVAACGADGEPLPPPGAQDPIDVNAPKPAPEEGERPTRPFILDGLL
jgi:predicted small lipoprotein YifL